MMSQKIKKEIIMYLYLKRTIDPQTTYQISESTKHSWNTIRSHLDDLKASKIIIEFIIKKTVFDTRLQKYVKVNTKKKGYKINLNKLKEMGLM